MYAVKQNTSLVQILRKSTEKPRTYFTMALSPFFPKFTGDNKKEEEERLKSFLLSFSFKIK